MMRWIIGSSLKFRLLVVGIAAAVLAVGVTQLHKMSVDVLPEFGPPTVEVQTEALGLSAPEVEQLITVPMEQDLLNGVAFLDDIRSESVAGLSRILLVFEPGTNLYRARQLVAERLSQAHALPQVSKPPQMLQPESATNRVLMVGVTSKSVSPIQMSVLARWTIVPRLMGVPGVANIATWGQRDRQLQVQVDPERLRARDVSLTQVLETTGNALWFSPLTFVEASTPGTGGFIDTASQRLGVQHFSPITTAATLAQVPMEGATGKRLRLGDVASVVEDHQPLIGDAVLDNGRGLLFVVEKVPSANALDVTRGVERAIAAMRPGLPGVQFDTSVYRPATYIEQAADNIGLAAIIGAALLLLAFAAFVFRWRAAVIGLVAIPLSVVVAALVLYAFGTTMNAMLLAGLVAALAVVIDESVVGVDNSARRIRRARAGARASATTILEASLETRSAAVYGTLVVALATVPLFFLNSVAGAFFPDIVLAFLVALAAAMVVALTVTPALALLLLARAPAPREAPLVRWLQARYEGALSRIVAQPRAVLLAVAALAAAGIAAGPFLGQSLLPTFKESTLLIRWKSAPGTSLPEMNRITGRAVRELRSISGVQDVGAHVGRAVTADQVVGVNSGEIWVSVDRDAEYGATLAAVNRVVRGYPGLSQEVWTFANARARDVLATSSDDLTVRLYGENLSALRKKSADVEHVLGGVAGLRDVRVNMPDEEPSLEIQVNLAAAERYGIKPGDVRRAAATLLSGIAAGSLFEQQKIFDVVVWGKPATRSDLTSIRQLLIDTPNGGHVRLGRVAAVRVMPSPTVITRQAVSRYVDVTANVAGDVGAAAARVRSALASVAFPAETHPEVIVAKGQPEGRLISIGVALALAIFLLLQAGFGSWRLAALAFAMLPVALVGGLLAALADGGTLSFGSYMGLLAVLGMAARQSVLLITRYRNLERHERARFGAPMVVRGAQERLGPVLTASVASALVLAPLAVAGPVAGYEIVHPMAIVVLGGLVTSTFVNLFVLPALYLHVGPVRESEDDMSVADVLRRRLRIWIGRREMPEFAATQSSGE
jgi:CzcA family heavy metal efflux pump